MRRIALGCLLIALGSPWTGTGDSKPSHSKQVPLKLLGPDNNFPGQVWGQPYLPPVLSFRVVSGKVPQAGTQLCEVRSEKHKYQVEDGRQLTNSVITLHCEEGLVMELNGIDLIGEGQ